MNSRIKVGRVIVLIGVLAVVSCTVLPWVKDVNNIQDWIAVPALDTEYEYALTQTAYGNTETDYMTYTVEDVEDKSDRMVIEVREEIDGNYDTQYLIIEKDEGVIAMSDNEYFDENNDDIILATPVKEGNDWLVYGDDLYEIKKIGESKTVDAGTYSDCIVVERYDNNVTEEYYFSPSVGMIVYYRYTYDSSYGSEYDITRTMELRNLTR